MRGFLLCLCYIAALGILAFFAGRLLARCPLRWDAFPFRDWAFEQKGNLYRRLRIHRWHRHVPDMSRIFPRLMPPKRLSHRISAAQAEVMVRETCVAECVHACLMVAGLACPRLWPGPGGWIVCLVYTLLGNLPFILIQRFNRPKLVMLLEKCRRAEAARSHRP